jgi:Uma2 family endonuclease
MSHWISAYYLGTPGVDCGCESTIRLDLDNEPQPDVFLFILPTHGGQAQVSDDDYDDYIERAPELIAEVSSTRASYDLHPKLTAYRRNGVREYIVWRVIDREIDWFALKHGEYDLLPRNRAGIQKSHIFPGLWLDPTALIRGDLARVIKALLRGIASREHRSFVARLERQRRKTR